MSIYQIKGFASRKEYLESLADGFGLDIETVLTVAVLLGEEEDFDGLISSLEDMEGDF
jgi:hypothetical protein